MNTQAANQYARKEVVKRYKPLCRYRVYVQNRVGEEFATPWLMSEGVACYYLRRYRKAFGQRNAIIYMD